MVGAWIVGQAYPLTRAVRVRNALLAREGAIGDFDWHPANAPSSFRQETRAPSFAFAEAVARLDLASCTSDWKRALLLAGELTGRAQDRGPIRADLETTYERISAGYGYCADFVRVFLALAHAAGLCARQWGFSFDGFGGHGHTFVEIFDRARSKWIFLDVYNNFHVCDAKTNEPLSALEFRNVLLRGAADIRLELNGSGRPGYVFNDKLLEYYSTGLQQWYLICGNAVFSYEAHPLVRWTSRVSGSIGQVVATICGVHPTIQLLGTRENEAAVSELTALGRSFRIALGLLGVLALLLFAQLTLQAMTRP